MLNSSAEYALEAAHLLAHEPPDGLRTAGELAEALDLPANFLSKLLNRLRQEGILESRRGPTGGFRLARSPEEVTLAEVVEPFDDVARRRLCLLGRPECRDDSPCAAHEEWRELAQSIERFFRETTLADLGPRPGPGGAGEAGAPARAARASKTDPTPRGEESA